MRTIAALLSGGERGKLSDLFTLAGDPDWCDPDAPDTRGARPGPWCLTPPGHEAIRRLGPRRAKPTRFRLPAR